MSKQTAVVFNNTVLRDGHQSLAATRMTTAQMLPACADLDALEFGALETWGGATIDAGLRYLGEFPFERLGALRKACPKTPHMMLLRGQNIVQYAHFADDVVESFIRCSASRGMDIFRIFDALNDTRNMECAIRAVRAAGKQAHATICFTRSPVHDADSFIELGREMAEMGAHAVVIKDMAGLIAPVDAHRIVSGLKKNLDIPVWLHTHETAGLGSTTYYAAVEAGVDAIDTSIAPFANGTGQPDTLMMLALLENHPRCPQFDDAKRGRLADLHLYFKKIYQELREFTGHNNEVVDTDALVYQVPGGMLSNFRNQLKEQRMEDRFDDVLREIPVVRKALGWIPLVTPTSQIVGVQAMLNVKLGRWKNFSPQAIDIALGYYGRTPAPVDPDVRALAAKNSGKDPIDCRPADLLKPGMDKLRAELKAAGLPDDDEHCVIHAMFPAPLAKLYAPVPPPPSVPVTVSSTKPSSPPPSKQEPAASPAQPTPPAAVESSGKQVRMALKIDSKPYQVEIEEI